MKLTAWLLEIREEVAWWPRAGESRASSWVRKFFRALPRSLRQLTRGLYYCMDRETYRLEYAPRKEFFRRAFKALQFNGIQGDYAEFGCHGGMTFSLAYRAANKVRRHSMFWAFDSFAGLPPPQGLKDRHPQ